MKLVSVSAVIRHVQDLDKTVAFYETLGFQFKTKEAGRAVSYLNWFWQEFVVDPSRTSTEQPSGEFTYVKITELDELYQRLQAAGIAVAEPQDKAPGIRELSVTDPDGYGLIFFEKK